MVAKFVASVRRLPGRVSVWIGSALALSALAVGVVSSIARAADDGESVNSDVYADLGATSADMREASIKDLAAASTPKLSALQSALEEEPSLLVKAGIAAVIAGRSPSVAEVMDLVTSLRAADAPTRLEVARLLGRTRPGTARQALQAVVEDRTETPDVRAAAAVALGRAGSDARAALAALAGAADLSEAVRAAVLRGLALTGSDGVTAVADIAASTASPSGTRDAAIAALGDPDAPSGDALATLLGSSFDAVRMRALAAVVARGVNSTSVADALVERLADAIPTIRRAAVGALVALDGAAAKKSALVDLLQDSDETVQIAAIDALGRAFAGGDSAVADALAELVGHEHFAIRYHAALALGAMKDARGLDAMTNHAPSETEDQRAAADDAAAQIAANTK